MSLLHPTAHKTLSFINVARHRMSEIVRDSRAYVGSKYTGDKKGLKQTDCITFASTVLRDAFQTVGKKDAAQAIMSHAKKGTELAAYLTTLGWRAFFFNPDVNHPSDGEEEHSFAYQQVKSTKKYYGIPISGCITNYRPTMVLTGNPKPKATPLNLATLKTFQEVPFAFGIARGGKHTFLYASGDVWEAHWEGIGTSVFGITPLEQFPWLSGAFVLPPEVKFMGETI